MKERIDIVVSDKELSLNEEKQTRLQRAHALEPVDRVPVVVITNQITELTARLRSYADYIRSPLDNLREQILNRKWRIENMQDDQPIPTEKLQIQPSFGCLRGTEFDMEIVWLETQPPKCVHPLAEPEQIDRLTVPDPTDGLNARLIEWYHAMKNAADAFDIRLNGQAVQLDITLSHEGGPVPSAFALAGSNLFLWMVTDPERIHKLMGIVTESHIRCIRFFDDMVGRSRDRPIGLGCDAAEMISLDMFREFAVPYYKRVYDLYSSPRGLHNCGPSGHLLESFRDDLKINYHDGFGYYVDPHLLAEKMGGRVVLRGGPDPVLLRYGTTEEVKRAARRYIEILGRSNGFILSIGGGCAADTPIKNCKALINAARAA